MSRWRRALGLTKRRPRVSDMALPRILRVRAERVVTKLYDATGHEDGVFAPRVVLVRTLDRWYSKVRYARVQWFRFVIWAFNGFIGIFLAALALNELGRIWHMVSG